MIIEEESRDRINTEEEIRLNNRTKSMFHSEWLSIREKADEYALEDKQLLDLYSKTKEKTKPSLSDKVSSANIKDWKEQKWLPCAFFENFKKQFKDESQKKFTYENLEYMPIDLPVATPNLEEGDFQYINSSANEKQKIDNYGQDLKDTYLKNGLTEAEVNLRRNADGPNKLPEKKKTPEIILFLKEVTNVFSCVLWADAALSFVGFGLAPNNQSNLWLAIVIIMIILVTGSFAFYQKRKSEKIMESFKSFGISQVTVIREKKEMKISAVDLVKGDVVKVNMGEKIPADLRIFSSNDLQVDNSPLTGESIPVKITTTCGDKGKDNPLEATNIVFFSTLCKNGSGIGVVIQIGGNTFMGRIADLASSAGQGELSLQKEINHFIKIIATYAVTSGVVFLILGFAIQYRAVTVVIYAIGIVVANVPEALLAVVTISLAIAAKKMLIRNMMVKNMQSVETLGSITVICSDKTGTLTQNKMTVVHVWYDREIKKVKRDQEDMYVDGHKVKMDLFDPQDESFSILQFAAVCGSKGKFIEETPDDYIPVVQGRNKFMNEHPKASYEEIVEEVARLKKQFQPQYTIEYESNIDERFTDSDASETGILKFFEKIKKIEEVRAKHPQHINLYTNKAVIIPFNSSLKFTAFLRRVPENTGPTDLTFWLALKGAPERVIKRCNRYLLNGSEYPIDESFNNDFEHANKCFALKGERVLGVAYTKLDPSKYKPDFNFLNHPEEEKNPEFKYEVPEPNYPIMDLCFVGLIALEDPPREGVKEAIAKCHRAGIKVIMVTGDQTLTAASIAYQIGIVQDLDDTPEIIKEREGLGSLEEAEKKSNTVIVSGDRLHKMMKEDEILSEDNPHKGSYLRNWLMKRDVVFARTSPEQKLIIVEGCQKLSHVVAVTGDGVNDSPAIKKADVGIAMGKVGTDVAKDAADIVLLDDNFPHIIQGIKEGRRIFSTIKKIIGYTLTSNITEMLPFLGLIILQFPPPLTTIKILIVDIGTDIYPDIAFAYEPSEAGSMRRPPRNSKKEMLGSAKLFGWAYLFMGIMQASGAFLMYFVAFNTYGFYPSMLFYIVKEVGVIPNFNDIYNPYDIMFKGNSNAFIVNYSQSLGIHGTAKELYVYSFIRELNYSNDDDDWVDFRLFKYDWGREMFGPCKKPDNIGLDSYGPVCYRMTEALRYAQSAYLLGVVLMQISNNFCWRTVATSITRHKFTNYYLNSAYFVELTVISLVLYVPTLNIGLGLRPIPFTLWIPCLGTFIILILFNEFTKFLIRNVKNPDRSPGFFYRYFYY